MNEVQQQHWWFRVEQEHGAVHRKRLQPWWNGGTQRGPRYGSLRNSRRSGYALFSTHSPRNHQVATNISYTQQKGGGAWVGHGWYLQRQGGQQEGRYGIGFDAEGNAIHVPGNLAAWQRERDPRLFKIMLSPDHATEIDLHAFTRAVMIEVEHDLKKPLTWIAIDHHNTYPRLHVHVCLRGVDRNGQELQIARDYLWGGITNRAREVLTEQLGWRLAPELEQSAQRAIRERGFGQHDRSLLRKLDHNQEVQEHLLTAYEKQRLEQLEKRGLAWKMDNGWGLAHEWKEKMIMDNEREFQPKEREQKKDRSQNQEKQQERQQEKKQEQEREEQRRRVRIIDQLEQERGR